MLLTLASTHIKDIEIDWTALTLGVVASIGSVFAAVYGRKASGRVKTSNGQSIGEFVENMSDTIAKTAREVAASLEEARIVREHEEADAATKQAVFLAQMVDLEKARQRVSDEIVRLTRLEGELRKDNHDKQENV